MATVQGNATEENEILVACLGPNTAENKGE